MKKMLKRLFGAAVVVSMVAGMIQTSIFAARADFACDFNEPTVRVIGTDTIAICGDAAQNVDYPRGLSGRTANDYSARQTFTDAAASSGFQFMQYASEGDTRSKWERYLYECSVLYSGDADYLTLYMQGLNQYGNKTTNFTCRMTDEGTSLSRYYWQASYFKSYENSINIKKNQWVRLVLDLNTNIKKSNIYVNGHKYTFDLDDYLRQVNSLTIKAGFDNTGDGSKSASIAIDDVKVTLLGSSVNDANYIYSPTGDQATELTCEMSNSSDLSYDSASEKIVYGTGTTVKNVIDSIIPNSGSVRVIKSYEDPEILSDNSLIESGNIAVIVSNDGGTFKYVALADGNGARIVSYNPMTSTSSFTTFLPEGVTVTTSVEDGLYSKESGDYSFEIASTSGTPETTIRSNYLTISDSLFLLDSFTYEFSIAVEGDISTVSLINFASTANNDRFAYNQPVILTDGKMYVNDNGTNRFIRNYRNSEWYRIGITYYPKELKQDIYINGEKKVSKGWIVNDVNMRDPEQYQITSFYWNNIGVGFPGYGSGKVSIDDTLLYTGEHFDTGDYMIDVEPDILSVGTYANDIYVDDVGEMTISDLTDDLNISSDVDAIMYVDNNYSEEAEDLDYGNVLVLTSKNGFVKEYYTVMPSSLSVDSRIAYYVNDEHDVPMSVEGASKVRASIKAFSPTYRNDDYGVLLMGVYKDGKLVDIVSDNKQIVSDTLFTVDYLVNDADGVTCKLFFWDTFNSLKPYVAAETISAAE